MLHRLLPLLLIVALISYLAFNFQSIRRELAYKLNLSGDPTISCCSEEEILKADGNFDEQAQTAIFNSKVIDYPKTSLSYGFKAPSNQLAESDQEKVLGTTTAEGVEKWIEVSLDEQKLKAWEGDKLVMEFSISSGKWAQTPKGTFNIWYKTRSQAMTGGSKDLGTYYYLPNVPHNMFFHQGFAIHGAYWHNNFGQPMSHGCVNAPLSSVAQVFDWAGPVLPEGVNALRASADNPGTRVYVH